MSKENASKKQIRWFFLKGWDRAITCNNAGHDSRNKKHKKIWKRWLKALDKNGEIY
jgi:hypothetical protein